MKWTEVYCEETDEYYCSAREAERMTGAAHERILENVKGKRGNANGLHFRKV